MTTLTDHCFGLNIPLQMKSLFLGVFNLAFCGKIEQNSHYICLCSLQIHALYSIGLVLVETLILVQDMK